MWETVHVLYASADKGTGAITAQIGDVGSGEVLDPAAPVFQAWGFLSLPAPPVPGVSAPESIALKAGSGDILVAGRSVRSAAIAGLIKQGETAIYADGSQAVILEKLDGSINLLTTHDNTNTGRNVQFRIEPVDVDKVQGGLRFEWPWSRFKIQQDGLHYDSSSGCVLDLSTVTLTGPFAALSQFKNFLTARFDVGKVECSITSFGAAGSIKSPVARADATLTALQAIQAEIAAISATVAQMAATPAAIGSAPTLNPLVATALASQLTAVSAASTAITVATGATVPVPGPIGARSLATA